jgi:uncharacterized protein
MLKPAGALCNLACRYCYYLEKSNLYPDVGSHVMTDETLELFTRQYIEAQTADEVLFTWHGGETMMRPLTFYRRALELQHRYAGRHIISNCIQTNATLLTEDWCRFLKENNWLVGISIDGPQEFHDEYRRSPQGQPSFFKVMKGIRLLQKYGVEWNAMAVVNDFNADYPLDFYHFFKEIGCHYIQFAPIVERLFTAADGSQRLATIADKGELPIAEFSVTPEQWGDFLCKIFDEWVRNDVGKYYVILFEAVLANWAGAAPGICTLGKTCGHAAVMEFNGDVYSCDHFVFPQYKIGNIRTATLTQMLYGDRQNSFSRLKQNLPTKCRQCQYLFACNGECPKNRFAASPDGEPALNYLCSGYQKFFAHVAPFMDYMTRELSAHRSPANVMNAIADGTLHLS